MEKKKSPRPNLDYAYKSHLGFTLQNDKVLGYPGRLHVFFRVVMTTLDDLKKMNFKLI